MIWYELPQDLADVDDRLANWGRWARERTRRSRARSAEGRYLPERLRGETEDDRRSAVEFVDAEDATRVDSALAPANGFPKRESVLLKLHYVEQRSDEQARRALGVHRDDWMIVVRYALHMARNRLARAANLR